MNTAHRLADNVRAFVGYWSRSPNESNFITKGTLTPTEFVEAGDQLVFKFPTWAWSVTDPSYQQSWLPPDKQYLITRSVPCRRRVADLDTAIRHSSGTETDWTLPGHASTSTRASPPESLMEQDHQHAATLSDGLANLDKRMLEADAEDDVTATEHTLLRTRTYDLSISYDKYYQTPRLWLFGYDESGTPLTSKRVVDDIHADYVSKTITIDPHPFTGVPTVSIHPCKHAAVMQKVVAGWQASGVEPRHDLALFVLLKFISSAVPTIEYDITMDVDMFSHF
eukprot:Lankesteria_metandrocarpae@DN9326_c0_g1_i1.p1